MERQFRNVFEKALGLPGKTGYNLIILSRAQTVQMSCTPALRDVASPGPPACNHGHIAVNGKRRGHRFLPRQAGDALS
jgi:hypothetical protein